MVSGGKDSIYAVLTYGDVDLGIMLSYEFPRPSPHLVNIGKSVETLLNMGVSVLVVKLTKGREREETISILRKLGVDTIVAGDVYIEDHLKYMESIAREVGATLVEPLWGYDPLDLLYREFECGMRVVVIGCVEGLSKWIGKEVDRDNVDELATNAISVGVDPLGEKGEYHTLVIYTPRHKEELRYTIVSVEDFGGYLIARVI